MTPKYTLYIDESGDTGIDNVRQGIDTSGASPFLVFGGCLIANQHETELKSLLCRVEESIAKKNLHCAGLSHLALAKFARMVREEADITCFALISAKDTMGGFKDHIAGKGQDQKFYNKFVSYFLERVGHFMLLNGIDSEDVRIVFEDRANHDYQKLRNYLKMIKRNPLDPRLGHYLGPIDPDKIVSEEKSANELLCYADLVAYSVAAAINASASNFGVPEERYLRELKSKFFCEKETGAVGDFGLKLFKRFEFKLNDCSKVYFDKLHVLGVEPNLHSGGQR